MSSKRSGFTLIELVASVVLTAMISVALVNIVWSTLQQTTQLKKQERNHWPVTLLVEQLRRDFQNAQSIAVVDDKLRIEGYVAQDPISGQGLLQAGIVEYVIVPTGSGSVWVRKQVDTTSVAEPVWYGFGAVRVVPVVSADQESNSLDGAVAVPKVFQVILTNDQQQVIWQEVIHHGI